MLKELARLNSELRVRRPLSPSEVKQGAGGWQGQSRGQNFLRRQEGVGGGNIPGYDDSIIHEIQRDRAKAHANQRENIKDLINQSKHTSFYQNYADGDI
jgi:hypothetical protein